MGRNRLLSGSAVAVLFCLCGAASAQVNNAPNGATSLAPPARGATSGTPGVPANRQPPDLSGGATSDRPLVVLPAQPRASDAAPAGGAAATSTDEESFRSWTLQCVGEGSGRPCQITYTMSSGSAEQVVLVISMAYVSGTDQLSMQMALPLGLSIARGVMLEIGEGFRTSLPVSRCTQQGCLVEGPVAPQLVEAMRREATGRVTIAPPAGDPVNLPVSLAGFSSALDRLKAESSVATIGRPLN